MRQVSPCLRGWLPYEHMAQDLCIRYVWAYLLSLVEKVLNQTAEISTIPMIKSIK